MGCFHMMDNYDLWKNHDAEQSRLLSRLPVCNYCDEPIQEDFYFEINGDVICEICMDRFFRKDVSDYVG